MIPKKYELEIKINPKKGKINVEGDIYLINQKKVQRGYLDLHKSFKIHDFNINDDEVKIIKKEDLKPIPVNPAVKRHYFDIPEKKKVKIRINYSGQLLYFPEFGEIDSELFLDDRINELRIELASYSSWYPQFCDFGQLFSYDIVLYVSPDYKMVAQGDKITEKIFNNKSITRWKCDITMDIVVLGSRDFKFKMEQNDNISYEAYYTDLSEKFIKNDYEQTIETYNFFQEKMELPSKKKIFFKRIFSPKKNGQGAFQRGGMTVFSQGYILDLLNKYPKINLLKGNAHELAHMWWNFSKGNHDWINESFAEFFCLLALKNINDSNIEEYIKKYREAVKKVNKDAHCLYEHPLSNSGDGMTIRYLKGSLMLYEIYDHIKEQRFFQLCRDFYKLSKSMEITSRIFERFWTSRVEDMKKNIEDWLHLPGSKPL